MAIPDIKNMELLRLIYFSKEPFLVHVHFVVERFWNWFRSCPFLRFVVDIDELPLLLQLNEMRFWQEGCALSWDFDDVSQELYSVLY